MINDPYDRLPQVRSFRLTSEDVRDGAEMPRTHVSESSGGQNLSPQLSWYGFPPETRSFVVTMFDPDAPTPSGFWHWAVADIPVGVTSLPRGAGSPGKSGPNGLPAGAFHVRNDARIAGYAGAAPPEGHGRHRYFIVVHAVDVESLGLDADATPAYLSFVLFGRAIIVPWFETSGAQQQVA